jgi:hypothetical protein
MDIYMITDRNPSDKDGDRRVGRFLSNGSVASQTSQASRASASSPPVIISNRKYVSLHWHMRSFRGVACVVALSIVIELLN